VHGVVQGTILGGRYALRCLLRQSRSLEYWLADDETLEREVAITIVASDHPNRASILDAARRAAGVEDTRLVCILDVSSRNGDSFIVEESLYGAESLADVLLRGALPPEEARRVVGETASALENARQRGLHHLRLNPHSVLRLPDGTIKVSGVAVAAAIDGSAEEQEPDPATASRRDAIGVVALAYAGLTTRWPLAEIVVGVQSAPRVVGGVPAPSEIAVGVPNDLDALCRMTFNEDAGPLSPGDFASQIAPWSHGQVHRPGVDPTVVLHLPAHSLDGVDPVDLVDLVDLVDGVDLVAAFAAEAAGAGGAEPTVAIPMPAQLTGHPGPGPGSGPGSMPTQTAAQPVGGDTAYDLSDEHNVAPAGASAAKAVATAFASASAAAGVAGGKIGLFAKAAADKSAAARAARTAEDLGGGLMTLPEALSGPFHESESPLPMLRVSTAERPGEDQSKVVIVIVSAFVALALLAGYLGTRGLGDSLSLPEVTPKRTAAATRPVTVPSPVPPQATTERQPMVILSATGFDPEGDKDENNSAAPRVFDGNPTTTWTSEGYNTADFGSLGKKGVGVLVDLGTATSVNHVTLELGTEPVDVTVYAASEPSRETATVIGSKTAVSGSYRLDAASPMPKAQFVIVWFTSLAADGSRFRASLSEIALS
jgi:hypothetical protein